MKDKVNLKEREGKVDKEPMKIRHPSSYIDRKTKSEFGRESKMFKTCCVPILEEKVRERKNRKEERDRNLDVIHGVKIALMQLFCSVIRHLEKGERKIREEGEDEVTTKGKTLFSSD